MTHPRVSFVVLSYNYARYIGETIASILAQEGSHDFEIIVVDDASTDDSDQVIRAFEDPRIRYFRHERNLGHAATVTDGLRAARGDLVARIDSDDRYRPYFLDEVVPLFDAHPDVGLVYGDAAVMDSAGVITIPTSDIVHEGRDYHGNEYVKLLEQNFICAPTVIARRQAWLDALPIPEGLVFHDWYFTLLIGRNHPFYYRSRVLADYRVHPANYHTLISRNKSEEPSIMGLLGTLFDDPEHDDALEQAKQAARGRIYARHYLTFAQKYFGHGFNEDARRCYLQAVRHHPAHLLRADVARQLTGTLIGRPMYERIKRVIKRA